MTPIEIILEYKHQLEKAYEPYKDSVFELTATIFESKIKACDELIERIESEVSPA